MTASTGGYCRSCGARIRWVVSAATGKRMPLDYAPHREGTIVPAHDPARPGVIVARVLPEPPADGDAWRSHFATCPHADQHRRERG